jgi:diadenosine tetraphosphatase ApaH/serine/threonine PP2A family protein phosphatase
LRCAIISDIHGNVDALDAVLARIGNDVNVLCLGDIVGYGPNPNECVERVRARASAMVLGNHDVASVDNFGLEYFNPAAREAMIWTQGVLSPENCAWLNEQSYEIRRPEYLLVHGAPVTYFAYILDKDSAAYAFAETDARLIFVGHTHIAEHYTFHQDGFITHKHMQYGGFLKLERGNRYVLNVGSVGQPRDLNPDASFVLYDEEEDTVEWVRVPYAVTAVQGKILAAHLPAYCGERLMNGR